MGDRDQILPGEAATPSAAISVCPRASGAWYNRGALAIEHSHTLQVASLPPHHRDPFDRLLIAQAMVEGLPIMTADPSFAPYDIEVIWAQA